MSTTIIGSISESTRIDAVNRFLQMSNDNKGTSTDCPFSFPNIEAVRRCKKVVITGPVGVGKTTILRDLIRKLSNGIEQINYSGINVGVVDERGEIAAMYRGIPQNDVGIRTDVLDNVTKSIGMTMLIRSMAPKVVVADEIGNKSEVEPIMQAICSGIKGIFTAHGASIEDIKLNPTIRELADNGVFERIIFLSDKKEKGEIEKIYILNKIEKQYNLYSKCC